MITTAVPQVSVPPFKQHRGHCSFPKSIQNNVESPYRSSLTSRDFLAYICALWKSDILRCSSAQLCVGLWTQQRQRSPKSRVLFFHCQMWQIYCCPACAQLDWGQCTRTAITAVTLVKALAIWGSYPRGVCGGRSDSPTCPANTMTFSCLTGNGERPKAAGSGISIKMLLHSSAFSWSWGLQSFTSEMFQPVLATTIT